MTTINTIKDMMIKEEARLRAQVEALYDLLEKTIVHVPDLKGYNQEEHFDHFEKHPATKYLCNQIVLLSRQSLALRDSLRIFEKHNV